MILDEVKAAYAKDLLKEGKRVDGREFLEYRKISIEKGVIPNAEGSALVNIGDTKVVAGVKFDLTEPYPDSEEEGVLVTSAELSPLAHPEFKAGRPSEESIELARVIDRGVRSSKGIDFGPLTISEEKVIGVYLDLYIIDNCGDMMDAAGIAAAAALKNARIPKYEDEKLIREETAGTLKFDKTPIANTFIKIGDKIILDPNEVEETASDGKLTLTTVENNILCAAQKSGAAGFKIDEVIELLDKAFEKSNEIREIVKKAVG